MRRRARSVTGAAIAIAVALALPASAGAFTARGSAEQVYATGLSSGARVALLNAAGRTVSTQRADSLGGVLFRNVRPGSGYRVRAGGQTSSGVTVLSNAPTPPTTSIYNQSIPSAGYGYITMRDGTKLAIYVHPPQDVTNALPIPRGSIPTLPDGQTPTLIEYAGYGYADPAGPQSGIELLANLMGFTVVDVNMRGTGCSGGAFDFFEPLQSLDGYDVIETVARQPWVLHHKVGMMGISYGGISQLFTAQTDPPSLAAIAPLSVIDQTQTTLYPGGILNTGFAVEWAKERIHDAKPASPKGGQPWAYNRILHGDSTCKANQALHGEAVDLLKKIRANDHYVPKVADPLAPITFVHKIKVPVYMACQFTDEQTGGHCPDLAEHFTGTSRKWFTFTNGTHVDSLDPNTFNRMYDFLELYVAREAPLANSLAIHAASPLIYQVAMGINNVQLPPDPIQSEPTYAAALAAFEALPQVRVMFDNGAGSSPGSPLPGFERSFSRFPVPGTFGRSWYLAPGGALTDARPARRLANSFTWNAYARGLTDFSGDTAGGTNGLWTATPPYHWLQPPSGSALAYETSPLTTDITAIGEGAVKVWLRASKPRADLQVTVTEVRPDGRETFVQGGWLRTDARNLDRRKSSPLEPVLSERLSDFSPLSPRRYVQATIPLYYEGHVYRAGSRIRVIITAPNGDQPIWSFPEPHGTASVSILSSPQNPSSLLLPIVPGVAVPTALPPCPGLRGEPCRAYRAISNRGG